MAVAGVTAAVSVRLLPTATLYADGVRTMPLAICVTVTDTGAEVELLLFASPAYEAASRCVPTGRLLRVRNAPPAVRVPLPTVLAGELVTSLKVMPPVAEAGVTFAARVTGTPYVSVTVCPGEALAGETVSVVLVAGSTDGATTDHTPSGIDPVLAVLP